MDRTDNLIKRWWQRFVKMPDLGAWHRHILKRSDLLKKQRAEAPQDPCESAEHANAKRWLIDHGIHEVKALSPSSGENSG